MDATSPNAMVLDTPDDLTIDLTNSDKDDVVLISHDEVEAEVPAPPVASDCRSKPTQNNHAFSADHPLTSLCISRGHESACV